MAAKVKAYWNTLNTILGGRSVILDANKALTMSKLLSIHGDHCQAFAQQRASLSNTLMGKNFTEPWDELVQSHIRVALAIAENDWPRAYQDQLVAAQAIIRTFDRFLLPVLFTILSELRLIAAKADRQLLARDEKAGRLEETTRLLMRAFNFCLNDRAPLVTSRKWGAYYVMGLLFKCYIQLKTLNLARNLLRAEGAAELPLLSEYPRSHAVSYLYHVGLYYFWNEQYEQAEEKLMAAFQLCHREARKNKVLILRYLIPTSLLYGKLPKDALLKRHGLDRVYVDLIHALRTGNIGLFDETMSKNEHLWIQHGTFLVIERWRIVVCRQLIQRTHLLLGRTTRLSVEHIQCAFKFSKVDIEMDEVECIVANLIARGLIKGYISHEKRIVVLSKDSPFPSLKNSLRQAGLF